jgi:hypothetical protein
MRVTPTTVQVQLLKLVKLHRVLREKNFDNPMSFALVEIRDEANKPLYARDFRSLRSKFKHILTEGISINKIPYRYLRGGRYPQKVGYYSKSSRNTSPPIKSSRNGFLNHIQAYHESHYQSRKQLQRNEIPTKVVHPNLPF